MKGYHGRFLEVNLEEGSFRDLELEEDFCRKFIGGATMAAAFLWQRLDRPVDALSPQSPLIMATGPLTASPIPMVSRYAVCGISPLTGLWGEATSGGTFPFRLKESGWDGLVITGRASGPVYLFLNRGRAEIRDASRLWGKDTYETQRAIKDELGQDDVSIACIGQGGERLVRYASVINDRGRAAGRCGMGALMGSKNLKAVVAAGDMRPELADPKAAAQMASQSVKQIRGHLVSIAFREYGTLMYMDMGMTLGDTPAKYFTKSVFPASSVTGQALRQRYRVRNYSCRGCPIGCGREIKSFSGETDVDGPEYETVAAFGPLCMNMDLDSIIRANHLCNSHGIDTISAGVCIAYAFYLFQEGALDAKKVGFDLRWGDGEAVVKLTEMICRREGIGDLLSRGVLAMARELGRPEGEAAQVKGLEMPMHDGRAFHGLAVSYATGPRGACHLKGDYYSVDLGGMVPEYMILPGERMSSWGKGEPAAKYQSLKDLYDALTLCKFAPFSPTQICEMLKSVTGWSVDPQELLRAGDRSVNIKRALSIVLGLRREQDSLPEICLKPLDEGPTAGLSPDMNGMLAEYYRYRDWDWDTGWPSREKLLELGLEEVAKTLYRIGS
jgi:aldehyde:ferredoxin oxidoreductase